MLESTCVLRRSCLVTVAFISCVYMWLPATCMVHLAFDKPLPGPLGRPPLPRPQPGRALSFLFPAPALYVANPCHFATALVSSRRFSLPQTRKSSLRNSLLTAAATPASQDPGVTTGSLPPAPPSSLLSRQQATATRGLAAFLGRQAAAVTRAAIAGPRKLLSYLCRDPSRGTPSEAPSSRVVSFSRLLKELRSTLSIRLLFPAALLSLVVGVASFCRSYFLGRLFDSAAALAQQHVPDVLLVGWGPQDGGAPQAHALLLPLVVRIALAAAIEVLGSISRDALFSCSRWQLVVAMQKRLFASLLNCKVCVFLRLQQVVTSGAQKLLSALLSVTVGGTLMFLSSSRLAVLGCVAAPCVWLGIGRAAKAIGNLGLLQNDLLADINSIATEILANVRTVQAHGAEALEIQRYNACQDASLSVLRESILAESFLKQTKQLLLLTTDLGLLALGMISVVRGQLTLGRFVSFRSYLRKFYFGVDKLADVYADLQYSLRASDRYFGLVDRQPAVDGPRDDPTKLRPQQAAGDSGPAAVELRNVSFSYKTNNSLPAAPGTGQPPDSHQVLRDFSMKIEPGEHVALVGPSGAGKSTIAKVIQRFYDPQVSGVFLDGEDVKTLPLQKLRTLIGFVEQEPLLFRRSIADNIGYGLRPVEADSRKWLQHRRGCEPQQQQQQQQQRELGHHQLQWQQQQLSEKQQQEYAAELARTLRHPQAGSWEPSLLRRVFDAAAAANALAFVKHLPQGLFTICGEGGVRLSGGQKQRIAVARALLREPRLLILDEASSCLDAESEAAIREALRNLHAKTTVLTIAHKHSTIKAADRVAVVDEGRLVETGSPSELESNKNSSCCLEEEQQHYCCPEGSREGGNRSSSSSSSSASGSVLLRPFSLASGQRASVALPMDLHTKQQQQQQEQKQQQREQKQLQQEQQQKQQLQQQQQKQKHQELRCGWRFEQEAFATEAELSSR
ncbi:hypothetical protein Efla_001873 [Eimeria flavescens]